MIGLGITVLLLVIGAVFGIRAQKKHIAILDAREAALSHILVTNLKVLPISENPPQLVTGSVVIAFDYFRRFIATFVMLVGGRITMYEDMLDRARREALVRLLEDAAAKGAREVHNIRFEFSRVGSSEQGARVGGGAELLAYGTAIS
jgi:uncharacterized protein YbjQ (UPF0145 family)